MSAVQPWADCPPCPSCSLPCGTGRPGMPADLLRCSACGHLWRETDPARVEQTVRADEAWRVECARTDDVIADQLGLPRRVRR